jgi:hypothetical protein
VRVHFDRPLILSWNVDFRVCGSWLLDFIDTEIGVHGGGWQVDRMHCNLRLEVGLLGLVCRGNRDLRIDNNGTGLHS